MTIIQFKPSSWQDDDIKTQEVQQYTKTPNYKPDSFEFSDYELDETEQQGIFCKICGLFHQATSSKVQHNCKDKYPELYFRAEHQYDKAMCSKSAVDKLIFLGAGKDYKSFFSNDTCVDFYTDEPDCILVMQETDEEGRVLRQTKFSENNGAIREIEQYNPLTKKYDKFVFSSNGNCREIFKSFTHQFDIRNSGFQIESDGFSYSKNKEYAKEYFSYQNARPYSYETNHKKSGEKTSYKTQYIF